MKMVSFGSVALILAGVVLSSGNFPQNFDGNVPWAAVGNSTTDVPPANMISSEIQRQQAQAFVDNIVNSPIEVTMNFMQQCNAAFNQRQQAYDLQIKMIAMAKELEAQQFSQTMQLCDFALQKKQAVMEKAMSRTSARISSLADFINSCDLPITPLSMAQNSALPSIQSVSSTFQQPAHASDLLPTESGAISATNSFTSNDEQVFTAISAANSSASNDEQVLTEDSSPRRKPRAIKRVRFDDGKTPKLAKRRATKEKADQVMDLESFVKARPEIGKHFLIQHALMENKNNENKN